MTEVQKSMALFSGSVNPELADEIAKELGVSLGNVKLEKFANGEIYARYQESVRGAEPITATRARTARRLRASRSLRSSWPIFWPRRAWTTSSPSTCTKTPSRASSISR